MVGRGDALATASASLRLPNTPQARTVEGVAQHERERACTRVADRAPVRDGADPRLGATHGPDRGRLSGPKARANASGRVLVDHHIGILQERSPDHLVLKGQNSAAVDTAPESRRAEHQRVRTSDLHERRGQLDLAPRNPFSARGRAHGESTQTALQRKMVLISKMVLICGTSTEYPDARRRGLTGPHTTTLALVERPLATQTVHVILTFARADPTEIVGDLTPGDQFLDAREPLHRGPRDLLDRQAVFTKCLIDLARTAFHVPLGPEADRVGDLVATDSVVPEIGTDVTRQCDGTARDNILD